MQKLQYDLNNAPINIYVDRPNPILWQLSDINVRFFIIGKYEGQEKNFRKVDYITPDIKPSLVMSQNKLQNFDILMKFAEDYHVPFVHFESKGLPSLNPAGILAIKSVRANVNIFSDVSFVRDWDFSEEECVVIPNGIKTSFEKNEKLYHISTELPISEMSRGICPIVLKNKYTSSIIKNADNGFLYEKESDISIIVNRLSQMEEVDVRQFGRNARSTVIENFPYDPFLNSWKKLLRSMIT